MCSAVHPPSECSGVEPSLVLFISDDRKTCVSLVSTSIANNKYELLDPAAPLTGFRIYRSSQPNFEVDLSCPKEMPPTPQFDIIGNKLVVTSSDTCGSENRVAEVLANNKYIISLVLMGVGLLLLTVGGYKWDTLLGVMGFVIGFGFIFFIFWSEIDFRRETSSYLIIVAVSVIVGLLCGYLCSTFSFLSYVAMGFAAGFFLSKYLLVTFQFTGDKVD